MLELAILGVLHEQPLHGYELKKRLAETLGPLWGVSFGSIYPALRRLEQGGAVEQVSGGSGSPPPSTGSLAGDLAAARRSVRVRPGSRRRKAYRITEAGQELFTELLSAQDASSSDEDRAFAVRIAFFRFLGPERRLDVLERRRTRLRERLAEVQRSTTRVTDHWTRSLLEHRARATELDLAWIDGLLSAVRAEDPLHEGATP